MRQLMRQFAVLFLTMILFMFSYGSVLAEGQLLIYFIDVGQADASVLICDGQVLMIDGGNVADSSLIYSYLSKSLGVRHIDYMIATHPHEDHIGGLSAALNACSVGAIFSPVTDYDSDPFRSLQKYAQAQNVSITIPAMGDTFMLGSARVQFISPSRQYDDINDMSLVVRVDYGSTSFVFTGDAAWEAEHDMVDSGSNLSATLLKVGHHGSSTSSSYVFLRDVMPEYAVISVGDKNAYGHPTDPTLSRLRDIGATVYRTDLQGTIVCISDGTSLIFGTERAVADQEALYKAPVYTPSESNMATHGATYFIGNKNSLKFHYPDCKSVIDMQDHNKVQLASREEALSLGYTPCGSCKP